MTSGKLSLRPYQIEDVKFLSKLPTGGLFSEMRTGKTPTALMVLKAKGLKKNLIVCTASNLYDWKQEYETWLKKPCVVLAGTPTQIKKALDVWTDGAVISYDLLKTTVKQVGYTDLILKQNPESVIIDEAHRIKNPNSARAQAVFKLIKIKHRLALTGSPAPGKQHEIYSILHFLKPEVFKSYWKFIETFFMTIKKPVPGYNKSYIEIGPIYPDKVKPLQEHLATYCVQHKRKDVMPWLPNKTYKNIILPVSTEQAKYLNELKNYFETEHIITQGVLDRLIRYRQICNAPEMLGLKGKSPKEEWLKQYFKDYEDTPTIVFSKFTSWLKMLHKKFPEAGLMIGSTSSKERNRIKQDFQNGKLNILLINLDVGKEALTLDRAETCIFLDVYPPAGDIAQAEDRFVATTQDKATKGHLIIRVMMQATYDETLYSLIKRRATENEVLNDFKRYLGG